MLAQANDMTTHKPVNSLDASEPLSAAGKREEDVSMATEATGALEAVKVTAVLFIGLLVWPPLAVIAFTIVVPALVVALILGLLSTPYLLFHHLRGHHGGGHLSLLAHRLRRAGRALIDLAPHRIVADARKIPTGR